MSLTVKNRQDCGLPETNAVDWFAGESGVRSGFLGTGWFQRVFESQFKHTLPISGRKGVKSNERDKKWKRNYR